MDDTTFQASQRLLQMDLRLQRDDNQDVPRNPPPSDCGRKAHFTTAGSSKTDPFPHLEIAEQVLMKLRRPDLLCDMRAAVDELTQRGAFQANSYCEAFGSCGESDMAKISEHSQVYFVCPSMLDEL